jgi:hypothetical protein
VVVPNTVLSADALARNAATRSSLMATCGFAQQQNATVQVLRCTLLRS